MPCVKTQNLERRVNCSVLQCVAVYCSVCCNVLKHRITSAASSHCNTLQHTATHCNTLQHSRKVLGWHQSRVRVLIAATKCKIILNTANRCNTLKHNEIRCNTLQHTATHCNTLQHTATHCNTLQHSRKALGGHQGRAGSEGVCHYLFQVSVRCSVLQFAAVLLQCIQSV